ncbi:MAG: response regulator [Phycisphaerae bacterium]|nr:response regulator [Phycisphaerae bacterium]
MLEDTIILMAEDDSGHTGLILRNLRRAGILNEIKHFNDGQKLLEFIFNTNGEVNLPKGKTFILLLDIRMPVIDGIEILKIIKSCPDLQPMPVFMLTTTDTPHEINTCHRLGCNGYITKPIGYDKFIATLENFASFLKVLQVPAIG